MKKKLASVNPTIFIVDDEDIVLRTVSYMLKDMGIKNIYTFSDSRDVMPALEEKRTSNTILFLDLFMPYLKGQDLLIQVKEKYPDVRAIVFSANDDIETVVECMEYGATDYMQKPFDDRRLEIALTKAIESMMMYREISSLKGYSVRANIHNPEIFSNIITNDQKMINIMSYIESIAYTGEPVLIMGETGTGKELIAKAIHDASGLPGKFVPVDTSGLDDQLFSDTLFGHKKGAFTGADTEREGLVVSAIDGTLFLDEISDLSEVSQLKLLRLLQTQLFTPLGSDRPQTSKTRIVVAINRSLQELISHSSTFRHDLYYRLSTHMIQIPALRDRKSDIPLLVDYFVARAAKSLKKEKPFVSEEIIELLMNYHFFGNIRELENFLLNAVAVSESGILDKNVVIERLGLNRMIFENTNDMDDKSVKGIFGKYPTINELTNYYVEEVLQDCEFNQTRASEILGITRQGLIKRLKKYSVLN